MSKKKAFSGSTMTLRDFHGGSIPSDLPLPSAPGMVVERKNHDRPGSGGWMGSSMHRGYSGERVGFARQSSGTFARSYEEKVSYLPNPANIGRNYDEDERKPVDGHNSRGQGAEYFEEQMYEQRQAVHERVPERYTPDNKGSYISSKYSDSRAERHAQEDLSASLRMESFPRRPSMYQHDAPVHLNATQDHSGHYPPQSMIAGPPHSPYQAQESGQPWRQNSLSQQLVTPGTVMGSGSGVQNVWTARREGEYSRSYPPEYAINDAAADGRGQTAGARIAQASALEKISSGRWNSRILQSPIDSPQMYAGDYGQPYGGSYEGGGTYSSYNNVRALADVEHAVYADSFKNDPTRGAYAEPGRAMDIRDTRFDVEKASPFDSRREQFLDGRGTGQLEPNRHADDRLAFGETGWRGSTGHKESARFGGTKDGAYTESGYMRGAKDNVHYGLNEAASHVNEVDSYAEARSTIQSSPGWLHSDPSSRRDNADGKDINRGLSSDFERRGFTSRDVPVDNEYSSAHRSFGYEGQKDRGPHLDGSYHVAGKEDRGHSTTPYLKSREEFSQEVSDLARMGRFDDRSRAPLGSELDQGHVGRLHSPGSVHTSTYESGGTANTLPVECEVKGIPIERPKLKLLPRTKPVEVDQMEELAQEGSQEATEIDHSIGLSHSEGATGSGSVVAAPTVSEELIQTNERPKLSLKPRSQPVDAVPADSGSVKERMSLFGGARPRELVLKERGVDDFVIVGTEPTPTSSAPPMGGLRTPTEGNRNGPSQVVEKQEKLDEKNRRADQHDMGNARHLGRQESGRLERMESRGRREQMEKDERRGSEYRQHQEKREADRPDVDKQDSWRRPAEVYSGPQTPIPAGEHSSGGAGRAIQSAADLAQAFSRSTSFGSGFGGSAAQGYTSQRSPMPRSPGPGFGMGLDSPGFRKTTPSDVPFSRLTEALSPGPRDYHASGVQGGYRRTSAF